MVMWYKKAVAPAILASLDGRVVWRVQETYNKAAF